MKCSVYISRVLMVILPILPFILIGLWLMHTSEEESSFISSVMLLLIIWILVRSIVFTVLIAILHLTGEIIPCTTPIPIIIVVTVITTEVLITILIFLVTTVSLLGIALISVELVSVIITIILTLTYFVYQKSNTNSKDNSSPKIVGISTV